MKKCQIRSRLPIVLSAIVQVAAAHAATVVHLSFDDTVEPVDAGGGSVSVRSGTPAYTVDVPGPQVCWLTNETTSARRSNSKSLRLDSASVALNLTHQKLFKPNLPNATIEFFIKGESASQWAVPFSFTSGSVPFPFMAQANNALQYYFRADTWSGSSTSVLDSKSASVTCRYDDKKWHHVALTVTAVEGGTSEVRFYFDYAQIGSELTTAYPWSGLAEGMFLSLGSTAAVSNIDELRISDTPLTVGQFLRLEPEARDGDTLIHLSFDDESLSSLVRPTETPVLTSGALAFTNDVPHATIWTDEGSVSRANTGALHANNTITLTVPSVALLSPQPLTKPNLPNATIEFFIKGISAGGSWPVVFCIGDTQARFLVQLNGARQYYYRVDTSTTQNKNYTGGTFADNHWHHVALTIADSAGEASDITLYFDHIAVYSATTDSAWNGLNAMTIQFGNPSTDLLVDEFRVTKGVLPVSKFLPGAPKTEGGETLVHLTFDGTLASLGRADTAPVLLGGTPAFSQSRYSASIDDRKGQRNSSRDNNGSLLASAGERFMMTFPSNAMLRPYLDSVTIEFFLKGVSGDNWAGVMGFAPNSANVGTPPFPMLFQINSSGNLQVRFDGFADVYSAANAGSRETMETVIGSPFADNKWHHYAITIEPTHDGQTHYMAYRDYAPISENGWTSSTYPFLGLTEGMALYIGGASFYLDELRMTKGVLAPGNFLHRGATGMIISFR